MKKKAEIALVKELFISNIPSSVMVKLKYREQPLKLKP